MARSSLKKFARRQVSMGCSSSAAAVTPDTVASSPSSKMIAAATRMPANLHPSVAASLRIARKIPAKDSKSSASSAAAVPPETAADIRFMSRLRSILNSYYAQETSVAQTSVARMPRRHSNPSDSDSDSLFSNDNNNDESNDNNNDERKMKSVPKLITKFNKNVEITDGRENNNNSNYFNDDAMEANTMVLPVVTQDNSNNVANNNIDVGNYSLYDRDLLESSDDEEENNNTATNNVANNTTQEVQQNRPLFPVFRCGHENTQSCRMCGWQPCFTVRFKQRIDHIIDEERRCVWIAPNNVRCRRVFTRIATEIFGYTFRKKLYPCITMHVRQNFIRGPNDSPYIGFRER